MQCTEGSSQSWTESHMTLMPRPEPSRGHDFTGGGAQGPLPCNRYTNGQECDIDGAANMCYWVPGPGGKIPYTEVLQSLSFDRLGDVCLVCFRGWRRMSIGRDSFHRRLLQGHADSSLNANPTTDFNHVSPDVR